VRDAQSEENYASLSTKNPRPRIATSSSKKRSQLFICPHNKHFPSSRRASAIQIVRPSRSSADTQPQLHPALLRLSAMISQYFTGDSAYFVLHTARTNVRSRNRLAIEIRAV